jgi:hypothetical protein
LNAAFAHFVDERFAIVFDGNFALHFGIGANQNQFAPGARLNLGDFGAKTIQNLFVD